MPCGITQSYLPPGRGSISRPHLGRCYGRYTRFHHQIRMRGWVDLSRRRQTTCPESLYRSAGYTRCRLVKPAFCHTRPSRCEELAHSCYAVTGHRMTYLMLAANRRDTDRWWCLRSRRDRTSVLEVRRSSARRCAGCRRSVTTGVCNCWLRRPCWIQPATFLFYFHSVSYLKPYRGSAAQRTLFHTAIGMGDELIMMYNV